MKIGFDIDGCLGHIDEHILLEFQLRGLLAGKTREDISHYRFASAFPELTDEMVLEVFAQEGFLLRAEPCPFLTSATRLLKELGDEIHIVTARQYPKEEQTTLQWLAQHEIAYDYLSFTPAREKDAYVQENEIERFVEDRLDTAIRISARSVPVFLVAAPYNRLPEQEIYPNITRAPREDFWKWVYPDYEIITDVAKGYSLGKRPLSQP